MALWQQRLEDEKIELGKKLNKLEDFFLTNDYRKLDSEDKLLLGQQHKHMFDYYDVLKKRLLKWSRAELSKNQIKE